MQNPSSRHGFNAWCGHNLLAGLLVGLVGGFANFAALCRGEGVSVRAVAGIPLSAAACGVLLLFVGALIAPLMMTHRGRWLGALLHGIATSLLATALLTSVLLRVTTGGYMTLGAIEFGMAAERHVMGVALGPFLGWTLGLFAAALVVLIGAMWLALRRYEHPTHFRLARAALVGTPSALIIGALPPLALDGLAATSPELALIASFDESAQEMAAPGPEPLQSSRPLTAELGPPLSDVERWRQATKSPRGERPNVLVLTLESVAYRHMGYAGYPRDTTPNIDRIAEQSLRMRRAWTTATHSNYAQMAIVSSLFPRRGSGLDVYQRVDYPRALLHDVFAELGYATATISSQDENWQGMRRFQETGTPTYYWHSPDFRGLHIDTGAELVVPDGATVDHALGFIERQDGRRWAMYMNLQVTHFPYTLPAGADHPFQPTGPIRGDFSYVYWTPQDREVVVNRYDNALRYVDEQVGRLAQRLEELGELDNTLWVITSDHGELFGEHDLVTHGRTLFDKEARVPLLVHWPKRLRSADVYEPVSHLDILPSILDLMRLPPHPAFQGKSFVTPRPLPEAPTGVYMNIQGLKSSDGLVCWPWKLVADRTARRVSLYNLEQDPDELDDRAGREVGVAADMFRVLRAQMVAQVQYHKPKSTDRTKRYAPRMLACPNLPGARRAEVETAKREPVRKN